MKNTGRVPTPTDGDCSYWAPNAVQASRQGWTPDSTVQCRGPGDCLRATHAEGKKRPLGGTFPPYIISKIDSIVRSGCAVRCERVKEEWEIRFGPGPVGGLVGKIPVDPPSIAVGKLTNELAKKLAAGRLKSQPVILIRRQGTTI